MKAAFVVIFLLSTILLNAKDKHAPLPEAILSSKTVFIDNHAGRAEFADRCYDELTKWGKYAVVSDPQKADLIFRITTEIHTVGYTSHALATGDENSAYANGTSTAIQKGTTYLQVVDRKSSDILWSQGRPYGMFHSATRSIIKELRERIEEQQKQQ